MNRKLLSAAAVTIGALLAGTTARADLISIGLQEDGLPVTPTTVATGNGSAATGTITFGDYSVQASGTGTPILPEPFLSANTIDVQQTGSGTHTLTVFVTEQGLTTPQGVAAFLSGFTSNIQTASSVTLESLIDTGNGLYTGTVLNSATFSASPLLQTEESLDNTPNLAGSYSETAEFMITTTAVGQSANLTITITPAPDIGRGLPVALGIVGLLFGVRLWDRSRKRRSLEFATPQAA